MRTFIIIAVLFFQLIPVLAQERKVKLPTYKIWVYALDNNKIKGILHQADEEGIVVNQSSNSRQQNLLRIEAERISHIKIRRKGNVGRSTAIGFAAGAAAGGTLGYLVGDDDGSDWLVPEKDDSAFVGAAVFGIIGAGTGAAIGTKKKRFYINGDTKLYSNLLKTLVNYDQMPDE